MDESRIKTMSKHAQQFIISARVCKDAFLLTHGKYCYNVALTKKSAITIIEFPIYYCTDTFNFCFKGVVKLVKSKLFCENGNKCTFGQNMGFWTHFGLVFKYGKVEYEI